MRVIAPALALLLAGIPSLAAPLASATVLGPEVGICPTALSECIVCVEWDYGDEYGPHVDPSSWSYFPWNGGTVYVSTILSSGIRDCRTSIPLPVVLEGILP